MLRGDLGFDGVVISDDLGGARQVAASPPAARRCGSSPPAATSCSPSTPTTLPAMYRAVLHRARDRREASAPRSRPRRSGSSPPSSARACSTSGTGGRGYLPATHGGQAGRHVGQGRARAPDHLHVRAPGERRARTSCGCGRRRTARTPIEAYSLDGQPEEPLPQLAAGPVRQLAGPARLPREGRPSSTSPSAWSPT